MPSKLKRAAARVIKLGRIPTTTLDADVDLDRIAHRPAELRAAIAFADERDARETRDAIAAGNPNLETLDLKIR